MLELTQRLRRVEAVLAAVALLAGSPAIAADDVVVSGNLDVASGPSVVAWPGNAVVRPGSAPRTITGKLDVGGTIARSLFGLHQNLTAYPSENVTPHLPRVPFGTYRLWGTCNAANSTCTHWSNMELVKGSIDWTVLDERFGIAATTGAEVVYTFGYTPTWASSNPGLTICGDQCGPGCGAGCRTDCPSGQCAPPRDLADWDDFVRRLVTHACLNDLGNPQSGSRCGTGPGTQAGRIRYYELWNEPELPGFWCDCPDQACVESQCHRYTRLVEMAQRAYPIIKAIDPRALVVSPSEVNYFEEPWLAKFFAAGGGPFVDVVAFHGYVMPQRDANGLPGLEASCPYPTFDPTVPSPECVIPHIKAYRAAMDAAGQGTKQLWDTEYSYAGLIPDSNEELQAAFLARFYLIEASYGVARSIWYGYDLAGWGSLWNRPGGPLRAAGRAYGELQRWLVGAIMPSACQLDGSGFWVCPITRADQPGYGALAVWHPLATAASPRPYAPGPAFKQYRTLDALAGPPTSFSGALPLKDTKPILFETMSAFSP